MLMKFQEKVVNAKEMSWDDVRVLPSNSTIEMVLVHWCMVAIQRR